MSNSKAVKKPKNVKFWNNVKLFFLSLFSNDACVSAREKPWYAATILALSSVLIAVAPIGTNYWKQSGGDIISSPTYGMESGLIAFQESLNTNNLSVKIDGDNHKISIDTAAWNAAYSQDVNDGTGVYVHRYTRTVTYTTSTATSSTSSATTDGNLVTKTVTSADLVVYNLTTVTDITSVNDLYTYIFTDNSTKTSGTLAGHKGILYTSGPTNCCDSDGKYNVNTIFLWNNAFYIVKYPVATTVKASKYCYYDGPSFDLKDLVKQDSHGNAYSVPVTSVTGSNITTYSSESIAAWKTFFSDAWNYNRITSGWQQSGIMAAVFVGVIFFMGLMVFIMTRGKDNPYRIYTFWQTQKIAYWASLSPAILAMILTFIWPNYSIFYFIFLFGLRVMWMSMRSLRPYQQQQ